ncbi:MAG: 7TM diverse intracellular signaling domain-containing protein [Leptospiraceae bacterium]|nr:7TM diverse intracellular signaling domain-containing protein [Leptospiraceae bacterium]
MKKFRVIPKTYFYITIFLTSFNLVFAETIELKESEGTYFLMEHGEFLLDEEKTGSLDFAKQNEPKFQPIGKYFNIIQKNTGAWFRFTVKNRESQTQQWVAVPAFTFFGEKYILYQVCGENIKIFKAGRKISEAERTLYRKHSLVSFLVSLEAGEECNLYLYSEDTNAVFLNFILQTQESYSNYEYYLSMYQGAYLGIGLVLFFYNLFLLFFTRDKVYLYYILFAFWHIAFQAVYYRVANEHNLIYSEGFLNFIVSTSFCLVEIFLILFFKELLSIKKEVYPKIYYTFLFIIIINVLTYIPFLIWGFNAIFKTFPFIITCMLLPYIGLKEWILGNRSAKHFMIAWSVYFLFMIPAYSTGLTTLPITWKYSYLLFYPILFGSILEMTLFSLALGDRYNQIQKRNETQSLELLVNRLILEEEKNARKKIEMDLM